MPAAWSNTPKRSCRPPARARKATGTERDSRYAIRDTRYAIRVEGDADQLRERDAGRTDPIWRWIAYDGTQPVAAASAVVRPDDWETAQAAYIREACSSDERETWVAVTDGEVIGFIVLVTEPEAGLGRIELLAVDPNHQGRGVGTALNEWAVERFRELGMSFVVLGTGSDAGHAPARRSYEKAGFLPMPIHPVHFFKKL